MRLFRWNEGRDRQALYYSAWFYFPRRHTSAWWNVFQFKSRNGVAANDPFWIVQVGNRPNGDMFLFLGWWDGLAVEGPQRGQFGGRSFSQTVKNIPLAQWTHVEVFLRQSAAFDGEVVLWQDGVELVRLQQVNTRYAAADGANEWSVNNYGEGLRPAPTTIYVDDAVISTHRVG